MKKGLVILSFGASVYWAFIHIAFISFPQNAFQWIISIGFGALLISPAVGYLIQAVRRRRDEAKLPKAIVIHHNDM